MRVWTCLAAAAAMSLGSGSAQADLIGAQYYSPNSPFYRVDPNTGQGIIVGFTNFAHLGTLVPRRAQLNNTIHPIQLQDDLSGIWNPFPPGGISDVLVISPPLNDPFYPGYPYGDSGLIYQPGGIDFGSGFTGSSGSIVTTYPGGSIDSGSLSVSLKDVFGADSGSSGTGGCTFTADYLPTDSVTISTFTAPEPGAATLILGALASLACARPRGKRRRN